MEGAIKAFKEMIGDDYQEAQADLDICKKGGCANYCKFQNEGHVDALKSVIESHEYQALINSVPPKEDKQTLIQWKVANWDRLQGWDDMAIISEYLERKE